MPVDNATLSNAGSCRAYQQYCSLNSPGLSETLPLKPVSHAQTITTPNPAKPGLISAFKRHDKSWE
jgi:hypothetical protein